MRYWLIKGKPSLNKFADWFKAGKVGSWHTARPPRDWSKGDRLFFWAGSPVLRVFGLGVFQRVHAHRDPNGDARFGVRYLTDVLDPSPSIDFLRADPLLRSASFLKIGPAGSVFPLTEPQGVRLYNLLVEHNPKFSMWSDLEESQQRERPTRAVLSVRPVQRVATTGGGFGDSKENEEVERAAVSIVTKHYDRQGWKIKSVESECCGFDLRCTRGASEIHVEVKGVKGNERRFVITAGELRTAHQDARFVLALVTSTLSANAKVEGR